MKILNIKGSLDKCITAEFGSGENRIIEFVDRTGETHDRKNKWVAEISTQFGCAINCTGCDAGSFYCGNLSVEEMLEQVDYIINSNDKTLLSTNKKFKIHFSRIGEPSLNYNVIEILKQLPQKYPFLNILPSITSVAPQGREEWFERLSDVINDVYKENFRLQFLLFSTSQKTRDRIYSIPLQGFESISAVGKKIWEQSKVKPLLIFNMDTNFIDVDSLVEFFGPKMFSLKFTSGELNANGPAINNLREIGYEIFIKDCNADKFLKRFDLNHHQQKRIFDGINRVSGF